MWLPGVLAGVKLTPEQVRMIQEHPTLKAKVDALTKDKAAAEAKAAAAEKKANEVEQKYQELKASTDKDIQIAVLQAKMQAGLLMLKRAEGVRTTSAGAAEMTPGAGAAATPVALDQYFAFGTN